MKKVAILITVHNRCNTTLLGLERLYSIISRLTELLFEVYLVDDGSTDDTIPRIRSKFPNVNIIIGDGNLFWSGGMRKAWEVASVSDYDYYLWFNDDALLNDKAIVLLFDQIRKYGDNIIVSGAFCDDKGNVSYGGLNNYWQYIYPSKSKTLVHYMNGNLVLIPRRVYKVLGNIDKHYTHSLGDFDYGLRAKRHGIEVVITSDFVGKTNRHDDDLQPYFNKKLSVIRRFQILYSKKYNFGAQIYFQQKYLGLLSALSLIIRINFKTLFGIK